MIIVFVIALAVINIKVQVNTSAFTCYLWLYRIQILTMILQGTDEGIEVSLELMQE